MPTFTVHEPPPRKNESVADPERFVFVRDGFHFWAFVLAPLWLLAHRLWLALAGYLMMNFAFGFLFYVTGMTPTMKVLVSLLIALLFGFEAASIRRWTLTRRGWKMLGFVVGEDREIAEQRFYTAWAKRATAPAAASVEPQYGAAMRRGPPSPSDVIGLFPEPGGSR